MFSKNILFFILKNKKQFLVVKCIFLFFYFEEYKTIIENIYQTCLRILSFENTFKFKIYIAIYFNLFNVGVHLFYFLFLKD